VFGLRITENLQGLQPWGTYLQLVDIATSLAKRTLTENGLNLALRYGRWDYFDM
jgi:hypothetical protein